MRRALHAGRGSAQLQPGAWLKTLAWLVSLASLRSLQKQWSNSAANASVAAGFLCPGKCQACFPSQGLCQLPRLLAMTSLAGNFQEAARLTPPPCCLALPQACRRRACSRRGQVCAPVSVVCREKCPAWGVRGSQSLLWCACMHAAVLPVSAAASHAYCAVQLAHPAALPTPLLALSTTHYALFRPRLRLQACRRQACSRRGLACRPWARRRPACSRRGRGWACRPWGRRRRGWACRRRVSRGLVGVLGGC